MSSCRTSIITTVLALVCVMQGIVAGAEKNSVPGTLNNFVTGLLSVPLVKTESVKKVFANPREGWVFFSVSGEDAAKSGVGVSLKGCDEPLVFRRNPDNGALEAMLFLPKGKQQVCIGHGAGTRLDVRAVPELMFCYYPSSNHISAYGPYDLAYMKRHVLPQVNVLVTTGATAPTDFPEWANEGRRWVSNSGLPGISDKEAPKAEAVLAEWVRNPAITKPGFSGLIVDEFIGASKGHYAAWTAAVQGLLERPDFRDKVFYAWCGDLYGVKHEREFAQMLLDRGERFVWETYLPEEPTGQGAENWMHQRVADRMGKWKKHLPGAEKQTVVCLGYLSAPPESLNTNPGVDYQVFLDMQFHMLATDRAFKGLYGLMEYMAAYADEESLQYAHRLMRHYCIEGKTERMNADPYLLPHLVNPDFEDGLSGWTAQSAEDGAVTTGKMEKFSWLEGRYPETKEGDTYCCMKRSDKTPNSITQTLKALEPGRLYSVKLISANLDALDQKEPTVLSLSVEGAESIPGMAFQCVYPSCYSHEAGPYTRDHPAHFSFHRLVFRATGREAVLRIGDWKDANAPGGPAGRKTAFNFAEVQPSHLALDRQ